LKAENEVHARKPGYEARLCDDSIPEPMDPLNPSGQEATCPECNRKLEILRKFLEG
jgi:hypothetical protein